MILSCSSPKLPAPATAGWESSPKSWKLAPSKLVASLSCAELGTAQPQLVLHNIISKLVDKKSHVNLNYMDINIHCKYFINETCLLTMKITLMMLLLLLLITFNLVQTKVPKSEVTMFDSMLGLESDKVAVVWPNESKTFTFYCTMSYSIPNWEIFVKESFWFNSKWRNDCYVTKWQLNFPFLYDILK